MIKGSLLAEDWAYWVTTFIMAFILLKVYVSSFPKTNREKVLSYYRNLLQAGEFATLFNYFERYHRADLISHLKNPELNNSRITLANNFYWEILSRDDFIQNTANSRPYVYADLVACCIERNYLNQEFVQDYLSALLYAENAFLYREIATITNRAENNFSYKIPEQNRIVLSMLQDLRVAYNNEIWKAFGNIALSELEREAELNAFSSFNDAHKGVDSLPKGVSYYSIRFFDIMIREAILKKETNHYWLYYYNYFAGHMINGVNMNMKPEIKKDAEFPTHYHYLLYLIVENLRDWIKYETRENNYLKPSSIECLFQIMTKIAEASNLGDKFITDMFKRCMDTYYENYNDEVTREMIANHWTHPKTVDSIKTYNSVTVKAWEAYDKAPYNMQGLEYMITKFESDIIGKLPK
jgi:hypothetical protein